VCCVALPQWGGGGTLGCPKRWGISCEPASRKTLTHVAQTAMMVRGSTEVARALYPRERQG